MPGDKLKEYGVGERLRAADFNQHARLIESMCKSLGVGGFANGAGLHLRPSGDIVYPAFVALIHNKGPNNEADYTDNRYWLRPIQVTNTDSPSSTALTFTPTGTIPGYPDITFFTATNLAETMSAGGGSHFLPTNDTVPVIVLWQYDQCSDGHQPRWFFSQIPQVGYAKITVTDSIGSLSIQGNPCSKNGTDWIDTSRTIGLTPEAIVHTPRVLRLVSNIDNGDIVKYAPDPDDPTLGTIIGECYMPKGNPFTISDKAKVLQVGEGGWLVADDTLARVI